jgi:tRNA nucleotidyltransferase (CCA-adding enzyme)
VSCLYRMLASLQQLLRINDVLTVVVGSQLQGKMSRTYQLYLRFRLLTRARTIWRLGPHIYSKKKAKHIYNRLRLYTVVVYVAQS